MSIRIHRFATKWIHIQVPLVTALLRMCMSVLNAQAADTAFRAEPAVFYAAKANLSE